MILVEDVPRVNQSRRSVGGSEAEGTLMGKAPREIWTIDRSRGEINSQS
jgi:hypothetical protein